MWVSTNSMPRKVVEQWRSRGVSIDPKLPEETAKAEKKRFHREYKNRTEIYKVSRETEYARTLKLLPPDNKQYERTPQMFHFAGYESWQLEKIVEHRMQQCGISYYREPLPRDQQRARHQPAMADRRNSETTREANAESHGNATRSQQRNGESGRTTMQASRRHQAGDRPTHAATAAAGVGAEVPPETGIREPYVVRTLAPPFAQAETTPHSQPRAVVLPTAANNARAANDSNRIAVHPRVGTEASHLNK